MANIYVRSTDGADGDTGATWALARATVTGAAAIDAAGDTIWLSQVHAESTAASISFAFAGTLALPTKLLCGDDAAEPPTALSAAATVTTTGIGSTIGIGSGFAQHLVQYGITYNCATTANAASLTINAASYSEQCSFRLVNTGPTSKIVFGQLTNHVAKDCTFRFADAGQTISCQGSGANVTINGGSLLAGGTSPTALFSLGDGAKLLVDGFDLTNAAAAINLVGAALTNGLALFRNCKMPASWSGSLSSVTPTRGSVIELVNCDSADTHYTYRRQTPFGTIREETTVVRTGGQTIDATGVSLKMASNADAEHPAYTLDTPEIQKEITAVGASVTATIEFVHDSVTALKDNEIWIDMEYLGTSGVPLASFISDGISVVATAANQASSAVTWTTTGLANPNKQAVNVTFTPQEAGMLIAKVRLAKASYTVYVDPMITLT